MRHEDRLAYIKLIATLRLLVGLIILALPLAAQTRATLSSPTPGSTLPGSTATFTWSAGVSVTQYWLDVGNSLAQGDIANTNITTATSFTPTNIPTDGRTIYVRLWSYIGGAWQTPYDYTFIAAGTSSGVPSTLATPTPGSTLPGSTVTFTWTAGSGVTQYWLDVGNSVGSGGIANTGITTATSFTPTNISTDGRTIYVRLWSYIGGAWRTPYDYTFTAAGAVRSTLASPAPGSTLPGSTASFTWTTGVGVTQYWLDVGNAVGSGGISNTGATTAMSFTPTNIPTDGRTIYVRLWSYIGGGWQTPYDYTFTASSGGVTVITGPSQLQVNLGPMPFNIYDYAHVPSANGFVSVCPANSPSIRSCYQTILANYRAQGVTGVRFQFGICGGGNSTPLQNCGQNWTLVSGPATGGTWMNNVNAFFSDLHDATIYNITPTPELSDFVNAYGGGPTQYLPPAASPAGADKNCYTPAGINQPVLQYTPGLPFGLISCHTTVPYQCSSSNKHCETECQQAAGNPTNDSANAAYNCSPANPIFVGWQNIYNLINQMLSAAASHPPLNVFELDAEQETDPVNFTVHARFILDNAHIPSGNPDVINSLRFYMQQNQFDPGRVAWSATLASPNVAATPPVNCLDVYQDYARLMNPAGIASVIAGGFFGSPYGADTSSSGMYCGGTSTRPDGTPNPPLWMAQLPFGHSLPNIVDIHMYTGIRNPANGNFYTNEASAQIQSDAKTAFDDVGHFLSVIGTPSALFMIGETHSNTNNGIGASCEGSALDSASQTVLGYNSSSYAGRSVVFRPWGNIASSCYTYGANQQINQNNSGPYKPTQE